MAAAADPTLRSRLAGNTVLCTFWKAHVERNIFDMRIFSIDMVIVVEIRYIRKLNRLKSCAELQSILPISDSRRVLKRHLIKSRHRE